MPLKAVCMRFFCCCLFKYCRCCQAVRREYNPPLTEHYLKVLREEKYGNAIVDPKVAAAQLSDVQRSRGWYVSLLTLIIHFILTNFFDSYFYFLLFFIFFVFIFYFSILVTQESPSR